MTAALTIATSFLGGVVVYYAALFCIAFVHSGPDGEDPGITFAIFVPAVNEEAVLEGTLSSLLALDYPRLVVCVADDASTDATPEILVRHALDPRVIALRRELPNARNGKSDVLNECFEAVHRAIATDHPILGGLDPALVVAGIVDADGHLDPETLRTVAPYFADPGVGSVQIGVRIANADTNLLTRLQDMEFVGFSAFVQRARDRLGSVGLGGNGQFTRLSALAELHAARGGPWRLSALTEDLELGLALTCMGWRARYCPDVYVAQQGLPSWRPLFRQRTRWIQGHYSCWSYLPKLAVANASLRSRIDTSIYLVMIVTLIVVTFGAVVSTLSLLGLVVINGPVPAFVPEGHWRNAVNLVFAVTPLLLFMHGYQRRAVRRFRVWELPAAATLFAAYAYVWIFATGIALLRGLTGRRNWVKTPRVAEPAGEPNLLGTGG